MESLIGWMPAKVILAILVAVATALAYVLKYIVWNKHGEIMSNLDQLGSGLEKLSKSIDSIKTQFEVSLIEFRHQVGEMVHRKEYDKDMSEVKTRITILERISNLENQR